jgi:hypothetical protein
VALLWIAVAACKASGVRSPDWARISAARAAISRWGATHSMSGLGREQGKKLIHSHDIVGPVWMDKEFGHGNRRGNGD